MSYALKFLPAARREWDKLDSTLRNQFADKLAERLENPRIPGDALRTMSGHYKIKLRAAGYRLVYRVDDKVVTVTVVAVGRRDGGDVYDIAKIRSKSG